MAELTEAQKAGRQKLLAELASRKMEKSNLSPAQKQGRLKLLETMGARKMGDKGATLEPTPKPLPPGVIQGPTFTDYRKGKRPLEGVEQAKGGLWMAGAFKNKGALHKELGVSPDKPIPMSKINEAEATLNKKRQAGTKLTSEQARLSRRLALAKRAKTGDIAKMGEGGVVVPFEHIFGPESPYDAVPQGYIDGLVSEGVGDLSG